MGFAIFILLVLMVASILGTVLPQDMPAEFYYHDYPQTADLILSVGLDRVYSTWWYLLIGAFLSLSIFFCIVVHIKPILKAIETRNFKRYANYIGLWLLHLGLIIITIFFVIGNMTAYQNTMYNVAGTTNQLEGTDISVDIDDFEIIYSDDDHVDQYMTEAKFYKGDQLVEEGTIWVNSPITVDGYQFLQSSYGYYVNTTIYKDDTKIGEAALIEGEFVAADENMLVVELDRFYPDVIEKDGDLYNNSKIIKKPMIEYTAYLGSNPLETKMIDLDEKVEIGRYTIEFGDPDYYTILDVRKDSYEMLVGLGALIFMVGTLLVFLGPKGGLKDESSDN